MREARRQAGMGHMDQRPQYWQLQQGLAYSQSGSEQFRMSKTTSFPNRISRGGVWEKRQGFLLLPQFGALGTISASVSVLFWKAIAHVDMIEIKGVL